MAKKSQFPHKQYQKLANIIHKRFCEKPGLCVYGTGEEGFECSAGEEAEHIAASLIIRKGKVKVREMFMHELDEEG